MLGRVFLTEMQAEPWSITLVMSLLVIVHTATMAWGVKAVTPAH